MQTIPQSLYWFLHIEHGLYMVYVMNIKITIHFEFRLTIIKDIFPYTLAKIELPRAQYNV